MLSLVEVELYLRKGFESRQLRTYVCNIEAVHQDSRLKTPPGIPYGRFL